MLTDVPLRTGLTPAVVAGPWIKVLLGWGSLVALVALGRSSRARVERARRARENAGPRRDRRHADESVRR